MTDLTDDQLLEAHPIKPKRLRCIDPKHALQCRWSSPSGRYCKRRTHSGRTPQFIPIDITGKGEICELFMVGHRQ